MFIKSVVNSIAGYVVNSRSVFVAVDIADLSLESELGLTFWL